MVALVIDPDPFCPEAPVSDDRRDIPVVHCSAYGAYHLQPHAQRTHDVTRIVLLFGVNYNSIVVAAEPDVGPRGYVDSLDRGLIVDDSVATQRKITLSQ